MNGRSIRWCRCALSPFGTGGGTGHGYLSPTMRSAGFALLTVVFVSACRPVVAPTTSPAPEAATRAPLPPVPLVEGPLQPRVVYPQANQMIGSRDSTFILGSVGH